MIVEFTRFRVQPGKDERHVAFWRECIDPDFAGQDLTPEVHVTPARVEASMRPLD